MASSLHDQTYRLLMDLLTQARRRQGLTQEELAKRLGRPQSFVSKYERRERRLDVAEFFAVADALGVDGVGLLRSWREGDD